MTFVATGEKTPKKGNEGLNTVVRTAGQIQAAPGVGKHGAYTDRNQSQIEPHHEPTQGCNQNPGLLDTKASGQATYSMSREKC